MELDTAETDICRPYINARSSSTTTADYLRTVQVNKADVECSMPWHSSSVGRAPFKKSRVMVQLD